MNSTTSFPFTSLSMNCSMPMDFLSRWTAPRPRCLQIADICSADSSATPSGLKMAGKSGLLRGVEHRPSRFRRGGLQGQRVQHAAHLCFERLIDQLVLLHPRLALERGGNHRGRVMVAVDRKST